VGATAERRTTPILCGEPDRLGGIGENAAPPNLGENRETCQTMIRGEAMKDSTIGLSTSPMMADPANVVPRDL
jgi:hypothetical protein